jgi:hypothetical protein
MSKKRVSAAKKSPSRKKASPRRIQTDARQRAELPAEIPADSRPAYPGKLSPELGLLVSLLPYLEANPRYFGILRDTLEAQGEQEHVRQLDRLSAVALRFFGGSRFDADTAEQLCRFLRPLVADVPEFPSGYGVADVLWLSFGQAADLLEQGPQTAHAARQCRPPAERKLSDTDQKILAYCRERPRKGERIAEYVIRTWDHVRHLLARLVKEGRLRITDAGYETV